VAAAASVVTVPTTVVDGTTSGNSARSRPAASISSADQVPAAWSKALVLLASDGSVTRAPVSRCTTKSLASTTWRTRANASGSVSRTHMTLVSEYVGLSRCPVIR
jgi:hypothetical protein